MTRYFNDDIGNDIRDALRNNQITTIRALQDKIGMGVFQSSLLGLKDGFFPMNEAFTSLIKSTIDDPNTCDFFFYNTFRECGQDKISFAKQLMSNPNIGLCLERVNEQAQNLPICRQLGSLTVEKMSELGIKAAPKIVSMDYYYHLEVLGERSSFAGYKTISGDYSSTEIATFLRTAQQQGVMTDIFGGIPEALMHFRGHHTPVIKNRYCSSITKPLDLNIRCVCYEQKTGNVDFAEEFQKMQKMDIPCFVMSKDFLSPFMATKNPLKFTNQSIGMVIKTGNKVLDGILKYTYTDCRPEDIVKQFDKLLEIPRIKTVIEFLYHNPDATYIICHGSEISKYDTLMKPGPNEVKGGIYSPLGNFVIAENPLSSIAHEQIHRMMNNIYNNGVKPYANDVEAAERFSQLFNECSWPILREKYRDLSEKYPKDGGKIGGHMMTFINAFDNVQESYPQLRHDAETITHYIAVYVDIYSDSILGQEVIAKIAAPYNEYWDTVILSMCGSHGTSSEVTHQCFAHDVSWFDAL